MLYEYESLRNINYMLPCFVVKQYLLLEKKKTKKKTPIF